MVFISIKVIISFIVTFLVTRRLVNECDGKGNITKTRVSRNGQSLSLNEGSILRVNRRTVIHPNTFFSLKLPYIFIVKNVEKGI